MVSILVFGIFGSSDPDAGKANVGSLHGLRSLWAWDHGAWSVIDLHPGESWNYLEESAHITSS